MTYNPRPIPEIMTVEDLRQFVEEEFRLIAQAESETTALDLRPVHAEPLRPREGMIAYADGTDWDPGDGQGPYVYHNGAWLFLGVQSPNLSGYMEKAQNLADLTNVATALSNLGITNWGPGKQTVWVPAGAMIARTTNGPAAGTVEMTTNKNMVKTLDFDATTQEFAQFDIRMPKGWNEGTVTFIPLWSHGATVTNFGVVWGLDAIAISDDDALDVAFGTAQTSSDTGGTTNDLYHGPESSAITISGTPAVGDLAQFRIHRDPANGSDTLAVDARLHGVALFYTTDTNNDA